MISPFLLLLTMASIPGDQPPPPPPKREPDPEPDPVDRLYRMGNRVGKSYRIVDPGFTREQAQRALDGLKVRLSDGSGQEAAAFDEPPDEHYMQALCQRLEGTATIHRRPVPKREPSWPASQPWIPPRRVADPEKKRARKAQKRARRAGR